MKYPGMVSITETLNPPAITEQKDSMKIFYFTTLIFSAAVVLGRKTGNEIDSLDYEPDIEPYESLSSTEKPIFKYRKNGIKLDLKIVPNPRNDTIFEDEFPNFPANDIGVCVLDLSLTCVQRRIHNFLDKIRNLKEITLLGNWIKLVRTREPAEIITERRSSDSRDGLTDLISRDIDTFFDIFALRINLPSIQGKRKKNQIDIMFDENGLVEGRGKSGKGGKGGGGKCKKMMMMMLMMVKMKMMGMMGMTAMKSMMMAGMSLMISKWMLIQKLMDTKKGGGGGGGGGGPWQGGGGGGGGPWQGGGGGAPLKEIVLLTKASGGGGGGGGGGCCGGGSGSGGPSDSYGAPPPSSNYGSPAGGGYDSGGGGWGRSFDVYEPQSLNFIPQIVEQPSSRYERTATAGAVPVYENASPVYKPDDNRDIGTSSDTVAPYNDQSSKNTSNDHTNDMAPSAPQSQFVTLRSGYKIFPVKDTSDLQAQGAVENPIYVNDWKNFELAKQWTSNRQSSITSDHGAERSSQESFEKNNDHDYLQAHYPYRGLQVMDRNVVLQGV